ncbi:creatininase family protein [Deinococcus marmoris]|uniref:Creatinine amidohydrolase n=1 Tax=Deinococcus marmoris TaxID=249408 RepID=A0A1U7P4E7_9DEIO|nr:creatininase family protein [Deinococcus marmoris]OLV20028.1 Creatinine amidohydrolase [Deinococcus marmoris]
MTALEQINWMQVEKYLKTDDRCVLPLGSTEQHAHLSLCVDNILPFKLAQDALGAQYPTVSAPMVWCGIQS